MNTYIYNGTFKGLMSVFDRLFSSNELPGDIISERAESTQETMFDNKLYIETNEAAYRDMRASICENITEESFNMAVWAFLSEKPGIEMRIYDYLKFGFQAGLQTDEYLQDDRVLYVYKAARQVRMEAHRFKGFLRFEEIKGGVYYAKIEPDFNILTMLAAHFKRRLAGQDWIIHDHKRGAAVFFDRSKCALKEVLSFELPEGAAGEKEYREMWGKYFNVMGIKERKNPRLQRQFVPLKYRKNMSEFSG